LNDLRKPLGVTLHQNNLSLRQRAKTKGETPFGALQANCTQKSRAMRSLLLMFSLGGIKANKHGLLWGKLGSVIAQCCYHRPATTTLNKTAWIKTHTEGE